MQPFNYNLLHLLGKTHRTFNVRVIYYNMYIYIITPYPRVSFIDTIIVLCVSVRDMRTP